MGYVYIWICWKPFSQENIIWQVICRRCRHWMLERAYAFVYIINKKRTHDNTQGNEECWNGSHYSYVETINHPKWMCAKPTNIRYLVKNKKGKQNDDGSSWYKIPFFLVMKTSFKSKPWLLSKEKIISSICRSSLYFLVTIRKICTIRLNFLAPLWCFVKSDVAFPFLSYLRSRLTPNLISATSNICSCVS